jgi:hypothetical protein
MAIWSSSMKIHLLVFCLFCLVATSCILNMSAESDYQEIFSFGKEAKEVYGLNIVGFGGGHSNGKRNFNLTLMGNQHLNLDEARALFYDIAARFLERLNSNEKLRESTLDNFFSIANLRINIMLPDAENYITGIGNGDVGDRNPLQFVYFFTYDPDLKESNITYKEPYEQLKSIVEQQRASCDR